MYSYTTERSFDSLSTRSRLLWGAMASYVAPSGCDTSPRM